MIIMNNKEYTGSTPATTQDITVTIPITELQNYIDNLPKIINHIVTINVNAGTNANDIYVKSFSGYGTLSIVGANAVATTHQIKSLIIMSCSIFSIQITGLCATVANNTGFYMEKNSCPQIYILHCTAQAGLSTTADNNGLWASATNWVWARLCLFSNKEFGIVSSYGARMFLQDVAGTGNKYGIDAENGGLVNKRGNNSITGTTPQQVASGGVIFNNASGTIVN